MMEVLMRRLRRLSPRFRRYRLADRYLAGLSGIEIGGSANNPFGLDTINVDRYGGTETVWKQAEIDLIGRALPVDVVAPGDDLPFEDNSHDFVLASHVVEHFPDPIKALLEWRRVARRYVFVLVPHRDRTMDRSREVTPLEELLERHRTGFADPGDHHWTVWTCESFVELCEEIGLEVIETEDPDRKVGNGFAVVIAA
jgi:SAM-dependent methyltransferase